MGPAGASGGLIIVENEPLITMMIEDMARALGWTVMGSAAIESSALELFESCCPDLALLDIRLQLPRRGGVRAAQHPGDLCHRLYRR